MSPLLQTNTLLSRPSVDKILAMPREIAAYGALIETILHFQQMKGSASEIHTEIHLVKPILKILGYSFESKPKFFEDGIKEPDFALFKSDEERADSSRLWGTPAYYEKVLGLLLAKRYGRKLEEGIGGFYLDFESGIPLHQILYLTKRSRTPWGILTNGRDWVLMKRPAAFEKRMIQINLEATLGDDQGDLLHLFYYLFSAQGTKQVLPEILEAERAQLVEYLQRKRRGCLGVLQGVTKKAEIYPRLIPICRELAPREPLSATAEFLSREGIILEPHQGGGIAPVNEYNHAGMFSYLFNRRDVPADLDLDWLILGSFRQGFTKEQLFSMRILDMTPGFGTMAAGLVEGIGYLSFRLPYREKNRFISEWEHETSLKSYILDNMLYGAEKSHLSFDILQNALRGRFSCQAPNYRFGNPLLGMSLNDAEAQLESKKQSGLFADHPGDVFKEVRDLYALYFSLSDRIKEDAEQKHELAVRLLRYRTRIGEVMDLLTAGYFMKGIPQKAIKELLHSLDGDEMIWERTREEDWFMAAKALSLRTGFFHMELEFPFLLNGAFDIVVVQPLQSYLWEEDVPLLQATNAYIKRALAYLKQGGKIVLKAGDAEEELKAEFRKSKRFAVDVKDGSIVLVRK